MAQLGDFVTKPIPLLEYYAKMGASIGEFAGFQVPIAFSSVIKEHMAVRERAGVFDITHMPMIRVSGSETQELLEYLVPRSISKVQINTMTGPTVFLNDKAGIIDDIMIYKVSEGEAIIVGNAVNTEKDIKWIRQSAENLRYDIQIEYLNERLSLLALQGPKSPEIIEKLSSDALSLKPLEFLRNLETSEGRVAIISRSGWTGEDGFEIIAEHEVALKVFKQAVNLGAAPCGLAARDTLRLEMGYVLYGNDIDESITPVEARYWLAFDLSKIKSEECIGCHELYNKLIEGVDRVRLGIKFGKAERAIARSGAEVLIEDKLIGKVTSGGYSPVLKRPIAMAYINATHSLLGLRVRVKVRDRLAEGKLVDFPFI